MKLSEKWKSGYIYLDNAASTKVSEDVSEAMISALERGYFGNPDSAHDIGGFNKRVVDAARLETAKVFGAQPENVIFTSGGTEGNNLVIAGMKDYLDRENKKILLSAVEHASVYETAMSVYGDRADIVGVTSTGEVDINALDDLLKTGEYGLVSIMAMNNEVGTTNAIRQIAELCHEYKALYHTDFVQAFGEMVSDVEYIGCDFMTVSSHKIHGPQGVGAVYARHPEMLSPVIHGSKNQEFGLRGGTKNVLGLLGFMNALFAVEDGRSKIGYASRAAFVTELVTRLSRLGICERAFINGAINPKIISLRIGGVDAETLAMFLNAKKVCVSTGSACNALDQKPSRVLKAMGLSDEEAHETIRISFSRYTTEDELMDAARIIANCAKEILSLGYNN